MDPIICKGIKSNFTYLISMALQNRMQCNILALLFQNLAPTLNETREIISILLKELEALQSVLLENKNMLEKYKESESVKKSVMMKVQDCTTFGEPETIEDNTYEQDNSSEDRKLIEDGNATLNVGW